MAAGIEGRTPFLHGLVPSLATSLDDWELWSATETKIALRRAYADILPTRLATAQKRALRTPATYWRETGIDALLRMLAHGVPLLNALGVRNEGVVLLCQGCASGDPAAIPLAVALLSTVACLSHLAAESRLADLNLTRLGCEAAQALS